METTSTTYAYLFPRSMSLIPSQAEIIEQGCELGGGEAGPLGTISKLPATNELSSDYTTGRSNVGYSNKIMQCEQAAVMPGMAHNEEVTSHRAQLHWSKPYAFDRI